MGGATFSILVSLPSQKQAKWIQTAPPVPIDLGDAEEVERIKAMQPWQSRAVVQLNPLALAFWLFYCVHLGAVFDSKSWLGVWDGWQVSILSLMVLLFRLMALVSGPCFLVLHCSEGMALIKLEEQGLIRPGIML
eukprot:Skav235389  [mRNA]  locus=scaffold1262:460633:461037:- [translate_table: standard]